MLESYDIELAIDEASAMLTSTHPHQGGHIASLGARLKDLLRRNLFALDPGKSIGHIAQLFDICPLMDEDRHWMPASEIAAALDEQRATSQEKLVRLFYRRKIAANMEKQMQLRDERKLALRIAHWLTGFRKERLSGMIGPAWLEQHLDPDFWQEILWYCYDEEKKACDWNRFTELLPQDVRQQFDPSLIPLDVPERIQGPEQALTLLQKLGRLRGMTLSELTDPAHFNTLCREEPAYRAAIEFFRSRPGEESGAS